MYNNWYGCDVYTLWINRRRGWCNFEGQFIFVYLHLSVGVFDLWVDAWMCCPLSDTAKGCTDCSGGSVLEFRLCSCGESCQVSMATSLNGWKSCYVRSKCRLSDSIAPPAVVSGGGMVAPCYRSKIPPIPSRSLWWWAPALKTSLFSLLCFAGFVRLSDSGVRFKCRFATLFFPPLVFISPFNFSVGCSR